jgi:hypothetical protein
VNKRVPFNLSGVFPATPAEMDAILGLVGTRVPDLPPTPGRDKVVWKPAAEAKITCEQHPYHLDAPEFHRRPHWHVDTQTIHHERYLPGDPFPDWQGD